MPPRARSYAEFWRHYLDEHRHPVNRRLHLVGTGLALGLLAVALVALDWRFLVAAVLAGYGFAWLGHFAVEHNRPATMRRPVWSLVSDLRMFALFVTGRLGDELGRNAAAPEPAAQSPQRDER